MDKLLIEHGLTANIRLLHDIFARAMVDATTAYQDLENCQPRAAVGAVMPLGQALQDARALLDAILLLNRQLD